MTWFLLDSLPQLPMPAQAMPLARATEPALVSVVFLPLGALASVAFLACCCPRKSMAWVVSWLPKSRTWMSQVLDPKTRSPPVSTNRWVPCCLFVVLCV